MAIVKKARVKDVPNLFLGGNNEGDCIGGGFWNSSMCADIGKVIKVIPYVGEYGYDYRGIGYSWAYKKEWLDFDYNKPKNVVRRIIIL